MRIPSELTQLARLFSPTATLYLVGGAVRDGLLGIQSNDFDLACSLSTHTVKDLLKGSNFAVRAEYPRTGTLVIIGKKIKCEYTTFRQDSYPSGRGDHTPTAVVFTTDIQVDACRRDFTCNAIYYDITNNSFIDPTGGISDIKARLITTTRQPDKVLQEDALRILRIARLSCELGFHVAPETIASAREHALGLRDIAKERIGAEIIKIFNARRKHANYYDGFKPSYGLALLEEIGASELIFGKKLPLTTLLQLDGLKESGYYAYNTNMQLALIMLEDKPDVILHACENLALPKVATAEIMSIVEGYNYIVDSDINALTYNQAKLCVAKIFSLITPITAIMMACGKNIARLCEIGQILTTLALPTTVSELKINGHAVISKGYTGTEIGNVLNYVLENSIIHEITSQDGQLKLINAYGGKL